MRHWFKDQHFRSLLKNTSYLGASKIVAAVCGVATLALAGRGLGVLLFGTLILITSYVKAVSGIAKFQSWQLIVRYGGHGLSQGDPEHFKVATGFAFALDVVSGIGGMLVAVILLPFIGNWVGISPQYLWLGMAYCALLPIMTSATPDGVLRVLDRFDLISWSGTLSPIVRAVLAAIAFATGASFPVYVAIWFATDLIGNLYPWYLGWRELRRNGLLDGIRPTLRPAALEGAWRFAIDVNLASSVQAVWGPIGRLVVGGLLGPAGAALFRVASTLADSAQKPADLLGKAFYPEIMRMDLTSKKPWKLMLRGTALVSAVAVLAILILLVGGKPLMVLLFGKDFAGAYVPLVIMMIIPLLGIFSFPLAPMLYALGRSDGPLKAKLLGSALFFITIAPLSWRWDVIGAAVALVLANVANTGVMLLQLRTEHRRVRPRTT
ncbi:lipopolysaccharide biosynthesis protein [Sphingomonas flavescens]|uniref:lipopolysaccharide biosynthesis protein n=1 Tax=Sphingomonas flavescens TaxID=3132797 RepID=UPI002803B307|nr:lipopolysaccharide biosynthesis protein [Sphingomonas limnosediminicola]